MMSVKRNGVTICVEKPKACDTPALVVCIDGEACVFAKKVAYFDDEEKAKWFCNKMEEFFDGIAGINIGE